MLPTPEFRSVNFTVDYALARDYLSNQKTKKMFTWDKLIFFYQPMYKRNFQRKKTSLILEMQLD